MESPDVENDEAENANNNSITNPTNAQKQRKKKPKKKAKAKGKSDATSANQSADEIQRILDSLNEKAKSDVDGESKVPSASSTGGDLRRLRTTETELYSVEYRHLNAENELKRIFGAATTKLFSSDSAGGERRFVGSAKSRQQGSVGGGKLVVPKTTWPIFGKTGLSMKLVENRSGGVNIFAFEHGPAYRQAQFEFWEAVEFMNPDAFVVRNFNLLNLFQKAHVFFLGNSTK